MAAILCSLGTLTAWSDEIGVTDWQPLWTRTPTAGVAVVDNEVRHGQNPTMRIVHRGTNDWSLTPNRRVATQAGDIWEIRAWVKIQDRGEAAINAVIRDPDGKVIEWCYGNRSLRGPRDWTLLRSRFVVPGNVTTIQPRVIGAEPATVWLDGFAYQKTGDIKSRRSPDLPATLTISNAVLAVTLDTADATLAVTDRRTGQTWQQKSVLPDTALLDAAIGNGLQLDLVHGPSDLSIHAAVQLDGNQPEFTVTLSSTGDLPAVVAYPHPFVTEPGTYLVVPMNEGISYPVDDPAITPMQLVAYGGHGIAMAFWGVTDGQRGQLTIIETPDDAAISIDRSAGRLYIAPRWHPQKGRFGYPRRLRYVFLDRGGHVALCKRYRAYAEKTGLLRTLATKRQTNPDVDLLVGAVNVWCWDRDPLAIVRELKAAGIDRILWSNAAEPAAIRAMNELGVLTSRYDIYQDVMDPANFPLLRWTHPDWPTAAWPKDLMIDANGDWIRGWGVEGKDGQQHPCGVVCDRQAIPYAARRLAQDLKDHPYRCRFIDTTTASPWRECYAPDHPLTRSESRRWKMDLLRLVSGKFRLVTGSETGHDAAVPYVDYFEGLLSLGPYRVPDAGRQMQKIWDEIPPAVARFQVGHQYRLPLWELVYHDCVVAQWYWGDYNNKLPALWDKRDLFNVLYGTPPMFMFDRALWTKHRDRFVQSYRAAGPVARATGYAEMVDHRFLTPDRAVQQTAFANGITVTVNFGDAPYQQTDGPTVAPNGFAVSNARPAAPPRPRSSVHQP
ncbi:hypothetical protein HQ590_05845 [bacterium]|nr:hypothetical protein [bacterium]